MVAVIVVIVLVIEKRIVRTSLETQILLGFLSFSRVSNLRDYHLNKIFSYLWDVFPPRV